MTTFTGYHQNVSTCFKAAQIIFNYRTKRVQQNKSCKLSDTDCGGEFMVHEFNESEDFKNDNNAHNISHFIEHLEYYKDKCKNYYGTNTLTNIETSIAYIISVQLCNFKSEISDQSNKNYDIRQRAHLENENFYDIKKNPFNYDN